MKNKTSERTLPRLQLRASPTCPLPQLLHFQQPCIAPPVLMLYPPHPLVPSSLFHMRAPIPPWSFAILVLWSLSWRAYRSTHCVSFAAKQVASPFLQRAPKTPSISSFTLASCELNARFAARNSSFVLFAVCSACSANAPIDSHLAISVCASNLNAQLSSQILTTHFRRCNQFFLSIPPLLCGFHGLLVLHPLFFDRKDTASVSNLSAYSSCSSCVFKACTSCWL
jgi:hypothetical protein